MAIQLPPPPDLPAAPAQAFLYASVRDLLADRILRGEIGPGTVLKEAVIALHLGVSRAPVRRALALLAEAGLIRAALGQGYITGTAGPVRISSRELHDILTDHPGGRAEEIDRSPSWERIFAQVREEITACMPFGSWRIQEAALGDHYHVSRTVAREVLWRLTDRRLIEKDHKSHWIVGQLTARDLRETLEMRRLLEPEALARLAPAMDPAALEELAQRVDQLITRFPDCSAERVNEVETALFRHLSDGLRNKRMLTSIRRNQISLIVSQLFRQHFPMVDDLSSLQDYAQILHHLRMGTGEVARILLQNHLSRVEKLLLARLRVLSALPVPRQVGYLTPVDGGGQNG
ncbi:GntR family transcriptional regulator [Pseudogemmobacter faecipullorum]|uniref:GntR family transcriptional regulator n=1 Tax=Pseudogemmobacter faecipullorum TaxID=2755041 RepID=A0ABS8CJ95_9RHOB|nr:GntR family transcriptional regulator [Pseudogemmobacter faecipullorum]MCB5409461.1 GntR family transcriptional regulator [Pseudogemmobacter faecipullorum]